MRTVPAVLAPALPSAITSPGQLPALPEWYPLDPTDGPGYSGEERARRRAGLALAEALQGPWDGRRLTIDLPDGAAPPARFTPETAPTIWYTLDPQASNEHQLVYRYDPGCYAHPELIRAVEDGFREHTDAQYALAAREDDTAAPGYGDAHPEG